MQIVIEYVLIENLIINYFILSCCGALFKVKPKFWFLSAFLGAVIALFLPIFNFPVTVKIIVMLLVAIIMVCISFPIKSFKDFAFYGFGLIFLTFVFGGACYMVTMWFGSLSTLVICLVCLTTFIAVKMFLRRLSKKRALASFTCSVQIACKDKVIEEMGYIDSANVLYDPITSSPIVLISKQVFEKIAGEDYLFYLLKKEKIKRLPYGHFVNVGCAMGDGKMLVFMADKLTITEKGRAREIEHPLLGLSLADFSKSLNAGVLIHSELA